MDALVRDEPDRPDYLQHQAKGLSTLGNVQGAAGRLAEAMEMHGRALAVRERLVRSTDDPRLPDYQADLALSYYNVGYLKGQALDAPDPPEGRPARPRLDEALDALSRCAEILASLSKYNKGDARLLAQLCQARGEIGSLLLRHGPRDEASLERAAAAIRAALSGYEQLRARHPDGTEFGEPYAACCQNLGVIAYLGKQPGEAFAWFGKAEGEYQRLLGSDSKNPRFRELLGTQAFSVGNLLVALHGPKAEARRYLETAKGIQASLVHGSPENRLYRRQLEMTTDLLEGLR